jgi:4,5-DOPA dioxygenase extradiol
MAPAAYRDPTAPRVASSAVTLEAVAPSDFAPVPSAHRVAPANKDETCPAPTAESLAALRPSEPMPVLFLGHGSPMNALADNAFTRSLARLAADVPRPSAVLVVSAHWLTPGETRVLCAEAPRTIHDFWGFPEELYDVRYRASGSPKTCNATAALSGATMDTDWGLDHASWTVLRHMYPEADVPVLELSLDLDAPPAAHLDIARTLAPLRERGVLILGSGNLVHNLRVLDWEAESSGYDWAVEFDAWARDRIEAGDAAALADYASLGQIARLAVPTNDHYLPLLYAVALRREGEPVSFTYEGMEMGSLSMRCVRVG